MRRVIKRIVTTITTTYAGTAEGCSFFPNSCTRVVTYGTRTGSAPVTFCLTGLRQVSWGRLKMLYR